MNIDAEVSAKSSINTCLLYVHSLDCGAEKVSKESDKVRVFRNIRIRKWKTLAVTLTRTVFRFHSGGEGDDGQIHH